MPQALDYKTTDNGPLTFRTMIADHHTYDFDDDPAIGESRSLWSVVLSSFFFLTSPYRQPQSRLHGRARYGAGPAPVVIAGNFPNPDRA
jgi:hypothetical protein